jgi:hypothetical protein
MNTFRLPTRRIHRGYEPGLERPAPIPPVSKYQSGLAARQLLAVAAACAAVFAGAFAVAHKGATTSSPREAGPWAVPVVSAGSPIPGHLSSAPTIEVEAPVVAPPRAHPVHAATGQAVARAPLAERAPVVSSPPPSSPPPAAPVSQEAPASSPPAQAPPSAAPPAPSHESSGASPAPATPSPEAGKSFDTSG